ncbi:MAG: NAD(P)/FAD-dependent oxidoreductase [Polyangiaceae bacterium]
MQPEVIVVGGGPAGSTTAAILAREGIPVTLYEAERFPRHHIGESLQPAVNDLLDDYLGLGPAIAEAGFARKYGAFYVWGESRDPWSILFDERLSRDLPNLSEAELLARDYEHAWQVERSRFDEILLREAARRGVDVCEGVNVAAPIVEGDRVVGVRLATGEERRARFVVDASGQRCLFGRTFSLTVDVPDMRATSTYAYYDGAGGVPGPLGRHVQLIVTIPDGWVWFIPISRDRTSIGVVVRERARIAPERFHELVAQADLPLASGKLVQQPDGNDYFFVKDWSFAHKKLAGPGFVMVGDAACFVDPILSGGVDFAVRGAANASLAVLTALRDASQEGAALERYESRLREEYRAYLRLARYWYGNNRSVNGFFWEAHEEIPADSVSTPLRAFVYLTSGQYAADRHYRIFQDAQERKIFHSLGVDKEALRKAKRRADVSTRRMLVDDVVKAVFPAGLPARLEPVLDPARSARALEDFKLNPVLRLPSGPHRLALSDATEEASAWIERVTRAFPEAGVREFFAEEPNAARRMLDTDGDSAVFYLDDLHTQGRSETMCLTLGTDGRRSRITRPTTFDDAALPDPVCSRRAELVALGLTGGFWAMRSEGDAVVSAIWISESRYRKNADATAKLVDALGGGPVWERCRTAARTRGLTAYPDAIEIFADHVEVTIGFVGR